MFQIEMCITSKCNLSCKHCYQHFEKNIFELPKEKILEIINYGIEKKVGKIIISGGEASLHPYFYDMLNYLNNLDINVVIVTNATLLDIDKISGLNSNKFRFTVSVDGNEQHHDFRRGNNSYLNMINNVKKLKKLGFYIKANVTLDIINYKDIVEILENENFNEISFMPVGFYGAAKKNNISSSDKDFEKVIKKLYHVVNDKVMCKTCHLFPKSFSVKYNGDIFPCSLARDYELLKMGNIYEKSIKEICSDFINTSTYTSLIKASSKQDLKDCDLCKFKDSCNKGCRIRALNYYGDLNKPDPFACKLHDNGFENISFSKIYWGTNYDK